MRVVVLVGSLFVGRAALAECVPTNGGVEVCESGGPFAQVDNDCDGSVNTQGGEYLPVPPGSNAPGYYVDGDRDGFGDAGLVIGGVVVQPSVPVALCDRDAESDPTMFVVNDLDCADADALVNPEAVERCNGLDDNCDGDSDEPTPQTEPAPGCVVFHRDADRDGFGTDDPDGETVCVCPAFADDADNRPALCNPGVDAEAERINLEFEQRCWSPLATDCADYLGTVHPPRTGEDPPEVVDGIDTDCDGFLPLVELDCDDDGGLPAEWGADASAGLGSCEGGEAPVLHCFGLALPVACQADLWGVDTGLLEAAGVADGPVRLYASFGVPCDGIDCDDRCPTRCRGRAEVCDGVDNDCSGTDIPIDADLDGLPDALDPVRTPVGTVDPAEADVAPAGWLYECDEGTGAQTEEPPSTCEALDTVPRPQPVDTDEPDDDAGALCGCGPGGGPAPLGLVAGLAALALARRRGWLAAALLVASLGLAGPARAQCGPEVFYNGVDDDCLGGSDYDQDGDGYDCDGSSLIGAALCPGHVGTDCDDLSTLRHPGVSEVCEMGGPFAQVDQDCDGNPNTQGGVYQRDQSQLGPNSMLRYLDFDQDGFGEQGLVIGGVLVDPADPYYFCSPNAEPDPLLFVANALDCEDDDDQINPDMAEQCNGLDDNCNGVVDEPSTSGDPVAGATPYWLDADADGFGGPTSLGFCAPYASNPDNQPAACNPGVANPAEYANLEFDGRCWAASSTDCEDANPDVHPGDHPEVVDGIDTNCDGYLALVELDCDDDGGLPAAWGVDASEGMGSCDGRPASTLTCMGVSVASFCRGGIWAVETRLVQDAGWGFGPYRRYTSPSPCGGVDCDDLCPTRCGGRAEACDGVDNDCSDAGWALDADLDGLPDALDPDAVPVGTVDPAEADLSPAGGLYECDEGTGEQTEVPPSTCEPLETVPRPEPDDTDPDDDQGGLPGCACATGDGPLPALLGLLLAVAPYATRRRSRSAGPG